MTGLYQIWYAPRGQQLATFVRTVLSNEVRKVLGEEIRTVQPGWPLGMPVVRKLEPDLWEIRVRLTERTARILFTVLGEDIVLLHAFMKKSQRTPRDELSVARQRRNLVLGKS